MFTASTTTIRLPDDIKQRIAQVAEQQADFQAVAQQRHAQIAATGQTIAWADMRRYLLERVQERATGKLAVKPRAGHFGV